MTLHLRKNFVPQEPALNFVAIFEERVEFTRIFTLPCNTLVGIMDDGNREESVIENCDTHEKWVRRKGFLYFTPPDLPVLYTSRTNLHYVAVHFNLEVYPGIDIFSGMKRWIVEYSPDEVAELFDRFHLADRIHSLSCIREFCLRFCNRHWPEDGGMDFLKRQRFLPVLNYVREKATASTGVGELAEMMHLRPETFCREFTLAFRQPPKTFLQKELAVKAAYLLRQRDYRVKEVAAMLNFSSEFYFSKFFKRQTGISPRFYRIQGLK